MKNQVLSIEQMQKLKELGVDTSKASMAVYNIYAGEQKEYGILAANGAFAEKQEHDRFGYGIHNVVSFDKKPVFTLQDIIELLPKEITTITEKRYVSITECYQLNWNPLNGSLRYDNVFGNEGTVLYGVCYTEEEGILFAAYHLLVWVAENGYLTSK